MEVKYSYESKISVNNKKVFFRLTVNVGQCYNLKGLVLFLLLKDNFVLKKTAVVIMLSYVCMLRSV